MKEISLSQGKIAFVDDSDFSLVSKYKWHARNDRKRFYAATNIRIHGKRRTLFMHRLLLNCEAPYEIDHADRNGLNNCRSNIRICSRSDNMINRVFNNSTGFRGVFLIRKTGRFTGAIQVNKKRIRVGCFKTATEAAMAYNRKAIELHGKFAVLNKIDV